jgi:hypothetical protein
LANNSIVGPAPFEFEHPPAVLLRLPAENIDPPLSNGVLLGNAFAIVVGM